MAASPQANRREAVEAWWALIVRILSFFVGAAILLGQAFVVQEDRLWITVAGIGLCGPTVAVGVATVLEAARGKSPEGDG